MQPVDKNRLTAFGQGQRLAYHCVAEQVFAEGSRALDERLLFNKLVFRDGQRLLPWVKAEIANRFGYLCCETIEDFRAARGLAMTRNRHVKSGSQRHEKDDRDHVVNPRNFVLGWDNREKRERIAAEVALLEKREKGLDGKIASLDEVLRKLQESISAFTEAIRVSGFAEIDVASHEREIKKLELEREAIEGKSDAMRTLKERLAESQGTEVALQRKRDDCVARERELQNDIRQGRILLQNARAEIAGFEADGSFSEHRRVFPDLVAELADPPLSTGNLFDRKDRFRARQADQIVRLQKEIDPVRERLLEAMGKFLRASPHEASELRPTVDYLPSFLGLRQRILDDDLPRHEQRFKLHLNSKVIHEIGLFRNALEQERRGVEQKIEQLNLSLKKVEYRQDMHIQLEPRPVHDREIADFQTRLCECVEGSFEDSPEGNEARFGRIQELIVKLGDEQDSRWRRKVVDVRGWFDFLAIVIHRGSGNTVSVYQDSSGQSGGEKAKLAFTILVAAIAYQYDLDPEYPASDRFHFVVVDEMFSKVDDQYAEYALDLFRQFGLQLLIVAPLDAKARVTQPYVGSYIHVVKKDNRSSPFEMTAREFEDCVLANGDVPRIPVPLS